MQPTFLPWAGYFNLIASVDTFIFLDDVQFQRRSWQTRNRIVLQGREHLLTQPVKKCSQQTLLKDVQLVADPSWRTQHIQCLNSAYAKLPFAEDILALIQTHYGAGEDHLATFNINLIRNLADHMGIDAHFAIASELNCSGTRSDHLDKLCRQVGADHYLSPAGSKQYLIEDDFQALSGMQLSFQEFTPQPYTQKNCDQFISHMSVVDVIANLGAAAAKRYCTGK
jgi:hypothetical protein